MFALTETKRVPIWLLWAMTILLILSLLAGIFPQNAFAAKEKCRWYHEVARLDTLDKLFRRYGVAANQVAHANDLKSPYTIYVGQTLCIPAEKDPDVKGKVSSSQAAARAVYFTAGRTETHALVYTYNYPKNTVRVKAYNAAARSPKMYDLGFIDIAKTGNQRYLTFKLPKALVNAADLRVCLKDRKTGNLQCVVLRSGG